MGRTHVITFLPGEDLSWLPLALFKKRDQLTPACSFQKERPVRFPLGETGPAPPEHCELLEGRVKGLSSSPLTKPRVLDTGHELNTGLIGWMDGWMVEQEQVGSMQGNLALLHLHLHPHPHPGWPPKSVEKLFSSATGFHLAPFRSGVSGWHYLGLKSYHSRQRTEGLGAGRLIRLWNLILG